jgi:hypothetical protein
VAAISGAKDGNTVSLLKPITLTGSVTINKNLTLDLNDQLITNNSISVCSDDPTKNCYSVAIIINN